MFNLVHSIEQKQVKVIFLGNDAVGKTSFIRRFAENTFRDRYKPTLGVQVFTKENYEFPVGSGQKILIYLWDIGAQDLYEIVRPDYYVGVSGVVFMGDLTRPDSIRDINRWMEEVRLNLKYRYGWALALNKFDLVPEREKKDETTILDEATRHLPEAARVPDKVFLTSAKDNYNVTEVIHCVLSQIL